MMQFKIASAHGYKYEFWISVKSDLAQSLHTQPALAIYEGDKLLFKIQEASKAAQYFHYTHEGTSKKLTLHIDNHGIELPLFYFYDPKTVDEKGITYVRFDKGDIQFYDEPQIAQYYQKNHRPVLHFTPFSGWINDPNGLCKYNDEYHLFYQYHPINSAWGPMHWGHAKSKDLITWTHQPVFLHPEQNLWMLDATGGAFSGTAYVDKDNILRFFYTERLAAYDLYGGYKEIQKLAVPNKETIEPRYIETILDTYPDGVKDDFRDPKVWYDEKDYLYKMILGSNYKGNSAILLYTSPDMLNWDFHSPLYIAPEYFSKNDGRCVECPDFFKLGDHWVMIFGIVGYEEAATGRFNLLYALVGSFENNVFTPYSDELQILDFATEYYAMQSFKADDRQLAFAWLYNWANEPNPNLPYSGDLSLPREFHLNDDLQLCMQPVAEIKNYRQNEQSIKITSAQTLFNNQNSRSFEISLTDIADKEFELQMFNEKQQHFCSLKYVDHILSLVPKSNTQSQYIYPLKKLDDLRLFFDQGIIEVFANSGVACGTLRLQQVQQCTQLQIKSEEQSDITLTSWGYAPKSHIQ